MPALLIYWFSSVLLDARRDRRRLRPGAGRRRCSTPRSAGAATAEALLDRHARPDGPRHRPGPRRPRRRQPPPRPLRRPRRTVHARFDQLARAAPASHGVDELSRRAVRPRRVVAAARPRRPRLLVPQRRAARHAHGPHAAVVGRRRRQRLRRATSWPGVIRRYGDERFAGRIARAIVAARPIADDDRAGRASSRAPSRPPPAAPAATRPSARSRRSASRSTASSTSSPTPRRRHRRHRGPAGRIAVLTYHSGEDRIVKDRFAGRRPAACDCPPGLPCVCGARALVRRVRGPAHADRCRRPGQPPRPVGARCAWSRSWRCRRDRRAGGGSVSAQPMRRIDAPRRQHSGPLPRKPPGRFRGRRARSTERLALTPPAGTDDVLEMRPVLRVVPRRRLAANARGPRRRGDRSPDAVDGGVAHPPVGAPTRDRPPRARGGERPRRVRRAPSAARRAARPTRLASESRASECIPRRRRTSWRSTRGRSPGCSPPAGRSIPTTARSTRAILSIRCDAYAPRPTAWSSSRGATALARTQPGGTTARGRRPIAPPRRPITFPATDLGQHDRGPRAPAGTGRPDGAPRCTRRRPGAAAAAVTARSATASRRSVRRAPANACARSGGERRPRANRPTGGGGCVARSPRPSPRSPNASAPGARGGG